MTGLESGLLIGGKFLAPHAGKISATLAKKWTYRWRVELEMRRQTSVKYARRHVRGWLKTLTYADLAEAAETAGPRLAVDLDGWLGTRDEVWARRPDRASRALRLVEAAYLAVLKVAEPAVGRQLSEQWARQRNDELIARLVDLAGPSGAFAPEDLGVWLVRRSAERRRVRLAAFAIDPTLIERALERIRDLVPELSPGSFRALVGAFGAGKSEIAEEWHRTTVNRFSHDAHAPVPVWIHARDLSSVGLEDSISRRVGNLLLRTRGVAVVIDGLDEIDGAAAEAIARDARVLVAGDRRSSVLVTCRSNTLSETSEDISVDGLSEESARELVEEVAGRDHATWNWRPELIETVRRPFFALAAGTLLATGDAPVGQAQLIAKLVEHALNCGTAANAISSGDLYGVLCKLGVGLTRTNGVADELTFQERQIALSTRLVMRGARSTVAFALPVFEQWFAAQALLDESGLLDEALATTRSFDRWRWAIAIAILSGPSDRIDSIVEACLRMNPGAGAWVVQQVSGQRQRWLTNDGDPLDQVAVEQRLLRAVRTWVDAVGPLAPFVLPIAEPSKGVGLGVRVRNREIAVGWRRKPSPADEVVALPDHLRPFGPPDEEWYLQVTGAVTAGDTWPWTWVRDQIADSTLALLDGHAVLGPPNGVWQHERRYRAARIIMQTQSALHPPLDRVAVIAVAEQLLAASNDPLHSRYRIGTGTVTGPDLADLAEWLKGQEFESFVRPLPSPDVPPPGGGSTIWDLYTPEHLTRFTAEMLGMACVAYEELADTILSSFDWSLGMNACRPFGALGSVNYPSEGLGPVLNYRTMPMEQVERSIAGSSAGIVVSANGRAAIRLELSEQLETDDEWQVTHRQLRDWMATNRIDSPFWGFRGASTMIESGHERPASLQAARWVWADLQQLSLGSGTFPQLPR